MVLYVWGQHKFGILCLFLFLSFSAPQAFHGFKGVNDFRNLEAFFYNEGSLDKMDRWLNAKRNVGLKAYWAEVRRLLPSQKLGA